MRITYAEFENFKHLYSALGKYKVVLDFKGMTNIINVIIGQMGSGKTTILGHLQPWAGFGTLDERNSDGVVIEGMNGHKKIVFQDNYTIYEINHHWKWEKDHHSLKSYFKKNGEELNTNGNQSSFKDIVELEMGIDQNFLRLSRLGPNVANLISMTSAERKEYLASRLPDVDLYLSIAKDMNERLRVMSAQAQVLSRKLTGVTEESKKTMTEDLKSIKRSVDNLTRKVESKTAEIHKLTGEIQVYLHGASIDDYSKAISKQKLAIESMDVDIKDLSDKLSSMTSEYSSVSDITKEIGMLENTIQTETESVQVLQKGYSDSMDRYNELTKMKSMTDNNEYLKSLSETYAMQVSLVESIAEELKGFKCKYSSVEIKSIMSEVQLFDVALGELFEYDRNTVMKCMNKSEASARSEVTKTIDILRGKKFKLQKSLNNLEYVSRYDVSDELTLPTGCECFKSCPYYTTHPNVVSSNIHSVDDKHAEIMNEIDAIDAKIDNLMEYPLLAKKIENIRERFVDIYEKLNMLGVVKIKSLKTILTSSSNRVWYDNDAIVDILEKVTKLEKMYSLQVSLPGLKAELDKYSSINMSDISVELQELDTKIASIREGILTSETKVSDSKKRIESLTELCDTMTKSEAMKSELEKLKDSHVYAVSKLGEMEENLEHAIDGRNAISALERELSQDKDEQRKAISELNSLQAHIEDIERAEDEFGEVMQQQFIANLIKDAASSRKGIPLVYIKIFLDDCVGIINDLISMVFDDTIEIKEFNVTEKDFFIPYYKNGMEIPDVKYASQGERAIISLALSFALMRKGVSRYNILLLDEIDGALYSKDREKFLMILAQQIQAINAEQVFLITHNNCFDGYPINIIMTTAEHVDNNNVPTLFV